MIAMASLPAYCIHPEKAAKNSTGRGKYNKKHMKNCIAFMLFLLSSLGCLQTAATLKDSLPGKKRFSTIYFADNSKLTVHIGEITDSSIIAFRKRDIKSSLPSQQLLIPVERINTIERKNKTGISTIASMGLGALAGSLLGFSVGLGECEDPNEECNFGDRLFSTKDFKAAFILSGTLGLAGLITGIFVNKKRRSKFNINGRKSSLQQHRNDLLIY